MRVEPRLVAWVALGGGAGAVLRWTASQVVSDGDGFPWTTLVVNVTGSFLLALLPALAVVRRSPAWRAALGPGVLGGYTTFSAYSEQARQLLAADRVGLAVTYVVVTLAACLVAVALADRWVPPDDAETAG